MVGEAVAFSPRRIICLGEECADCLAFDQVGLVSTDQSDIEFGIGIVAFDMVTMVVGEPFFMEDFDCLLYTSPSPRD